MAEFVGSDRSFFGPGSRIEGNLEVEGEVRLQGSIQGKVTGSGIVTIGEQATLQANVSAPTVIVQGTVRGEIHARDRLELHKTAKVQGLIRSSRLRIDDGAQFEGECKMAPAAEAAKVVPQPLPRLDEKRASISVATPAAGIAGPASGAGGGGSAPKP